MPTYEEKKSKLKLILPDSISPVKIQVDCYHGTVASVSGDQDNSRPVNCGQSLDLGNSNVLKAKVISFDCAANNPDGGPIKILHKVFVPGGNSITYIFPDDYTGEENYNPNDQNPDYVFHVNFI